ncbi:MAG: hypothetical protein IKW90_07725 [Lachnospiraceae bacterium]|nr:hypothetical protein [Lachnospiraceae bacterium]
MYSFEKWDQYDYSQLHIVKTIKRVSKKGTEAYNNAVMMLDTETSKKSKKDGEANHIVAFTISIRYKHENLCTLYGHKSSELIECLNRIFKAFSGDHTIIYVHNLSYDWVFIRKYLFEAYGTPTKQLNTKSHYPIRIEFNNGLILRDSLILSQKSLDKWAKDMQVEHLKASGKWDYDKIRSQSDEFTADELEYIEHDTLAGVECIDAMAEQLHHRLYAMPYTATGIVREEARKIGKAYHAHDEFQKITPDFNVYLMLEQCFHGGFTHANRYMINELITDPVRCYDFKSSYPYVMLTEKYPMRRFKPYKKLCTIEDLLKQSDKYGFSTKLIMVKPRLKDEFNPMPVLQYSKLIRSINTINDNGRVLCAGYVEIYVTEVTLKLIAEQYTYEKAVCIENYYSKKEYLPRWFTDYIFKLFTDKCELDGVDPLNYMLSKAKLNSCYGMCVQKAIQDDIEELYHVNEYQTTSNYTEENYEKYRASRARFLPFQWGVWVTEYAMNNLHTLGALCDTWVYSDTDSVFGIGFNDTAIESYNEVCRKKLTDNGYGSVEVGDKVFTLGVAELDKECIEFKTLGAKRYAYRSAKDHELHITVAGVPKKGVNCLKNDINNFQKGFLFDGITTGKKQHTYIYADEPYIDDQGNETADSVDLSACDYLLDDIEREDWLTLFEKEISIQVYEV